MTKREKEKFWDANINSDKWGGLDNLVRVKYNNGGMRIVAPVLPETDEEKELLKQNPELVLAVQIRGFSNSPDFKELTRDEYTFRASKKDKQHRKDNTRTFEWGQLSKPKLVKK